MLFRTDLMRHDLSLGPSLPPEAVPRVTEQLMTLKSLDRQSPEVRGIVATLKVFPQTGEDGLSWIFWFS